MPAPPSPSRPALAGTTPAAGRPEVRVADDTESLRRLCLAWTLLAETAATTPFQTYAWNLAWWELVGARMPEVRLHVVTVLDDGRVVLVAPFMVVTEPEGRRALRFLSDPWGDYQDALVAADARTAAPWFARLADHVEDGLGDQWDVVELCEVLATSAVAAYLVGERQGWERADSTLCPVRELTAADRVGGRDRYLAGRAERRGPGAQRFAIWTHAEDIADRMPDYMSMHVRQWYGRPDCGITFTYPDVARFYAECPAYLAPAGLLGLAELDAGPQPIAFYFGFTYRGTYWAYRPAYEVELARLSPGHMLHRMMFGTLYDQGFHTFDMMRGDFAYKQQYATRNDRNIRVEHTGRRP